jgi:two-component system cell cycle sensor histidine kinase/response regulator CckA
VTAADNFRTAHFLHDLRNLLNVIHGCAESIREKLPPGETDPIVADLLRSLEHAMKLTRELLLLRSEMPVNRSRLDLNQTIVPIIETFARLVPDAIRLRLRLWAEPVTVMADAAEIERIVLNLALNARDAMPEGGILTVETALVHRWNSRSKGTPRARSTSLAQLRIIDTGSGMTEDVRSLIFEPFFTTKDSGTGLGLNSVAFTVEQLGGTILVDSQPDEGTQVTIHLPLEAS